MEKKKKSAWVDDTHTHIYTCIYIIDESVICFSCKLSSPSPPLSNTPFSIEIDCPLFSSSNKIITFHPSQVRLLSFFNHFYQIPFHSISLVFVSLFFFFLFIVSWVFLYAVLSFLSVSWPCFRFGSF